MEEIIHYVKPELSVVIIVLYFWESSLKKSEMIKDKYIPLILEGTGIFLCSIWVISTSDFCTMQDIAMALFTAIVQGMLVSGASLYINLVAKKNNKEIL